jgi:nucleotide-binding universal stress UspA family protein
MPTLQASLRIAFDNVLFPTDFTSASDAAVSYAQALARSFGSKIYVTHAVTPYPPVFLPMEPVPIELDSMWHDAEEGMTHFLDLDALKNTKHEGILERGELWNVLAEVIRRHSIDLIILGTHGRHGLKKLVLGSAAEQIFRKASCPVLTIGPQVRKLDGNGARFKQIIFATDFSSGSLRALPYALSLAEENQAHVVLLHVIPLVPLHQQEQVAASAREQLLGLVPPGTADWCRPECVVRFEFPAEGILSVAQSQQADLIVMGVHKAAPVAASHLPWAIAYEVVCHATCPVLTVRG